MTTETINFIEVLQHIPEGWCGADKAEHLFDLTLQSGCTMSLELGVFGGRSLIPIAMAHKEAGRGFVLGVDSWSRAASLEGTNDQANAEWWASLNYSSIYKSCTDAIDHFNLNDVCGTVRMKSLIFGTLIANDSVSLLHQDSNHSEEVTCAEVMMFAPKIMKGGIWVSDDSNWSTVKPSLKMLEGFGFDMLGEYENDQGKYTVFKKV